MRVLKGSFPMNTNMTGLDGFQKYCIIVLWRKIASALEGLIAMFKTFYTHVTISFYFPHGVYYNSIRYKQ